MKKEEIVQEKLLQNYEKYYRLAYSYVHNEADAQDIVQEGAYRAILNSDSLKKEEYVETWIYRIMINEAISFLRRNKKDVIPMDEVQEASMDKYSDPDLKQAMDALDPKDKAIVVLRYFEDMKLEQIAEITKENINTVKSRLYRALKKLGILLSERTE